jgi:hypothetical protein
MLSVGFLHMTGFLLPVDFSTMTFRGLIGRVPGMRLQIGLPNNGNDDTAACKCGDGAAIPVSCPLQSLTI